MKFYLLLSACLALILSSCKKKSDVVGPTNMITATVNGVNVNFNSDASAQIVTNEIGGYPNLLDINGATSTHGNKALITVTVSSKNAITSGSFPASGTNKPGAGFFSITYEQTVDSTSQLANPYITDNSGLYPTTVTITSISSTNVQGTFTGTLVYYTTGTQNKPVPVTNGKFNLSITLAVYRILETHRLFRSIPADIMGISPDGKAAVEKMKG